VRIAVVSPLSASQPAYARLWLKNPEKGILALALFFQRCPAPWSMAAFGPGRLLALSSSNATVVAHLLGEVKDTDSFVALIECGMRTAAK